VITISIFDKRTIHIKRKKFSCYRNVTAASYARLMRVINDHTWHCSVGGGGQRFWGPCKFTLPSATTSPEPDNESYTAIEIPCAFCGELQCVDEAKCEAARQKLRQKVAAGGWKV
jgi:hypothetical protein